MIIKEIQIKNFRSYYGDDNHFNFENGLTIIIGDAGDGKTTFFEAIQWLLNTQKESGNQGLVSEMKKSEMDPGETSEVSVYMKFDHNGEKSVEKSFSFEKLENGGIRVGKSDYFGYESNGIEREPVNGKELIERCYDAFIQRFTMFKGQAELNVFDDPTALRQLVEKFSDIRKFDALVKITENFEIKANSSYLKEMRSDKKVAERARILESSITRLSGEITSTKENIRDKRNSIETFAQRLTELEENQEASERYKDIQDRLKTQEEKRDRYIGQINSVDYNHALLDKMWILVAFPPILKTFQEKISTMSKTKRRMDKEFERTKAIEIGKLEAIKEMQGALINGTTELPWYLPDQQTMEDMINDHICKVCGREAPIGSAAYEFMMHKLDEYKRHAEAKLKKEASQKEIKEQELFTDKQIETLHNLSVQLSGMREAEIANYAQDIADRQGLVAKLQEELKKTNNKIQDIIDEKTRLLIQVGNISEATLEKEFSDIRGLYNQRERATNRLTELETQLKFQETQMDGLKKELDALDPESSHVKVMRDVHTALEEIANAFAQAKKKNLMHFLNELQEQANQYLMKLSTYDFHGEIRLIQTANESTEIRLFSSNGAEVIHPSGSQGTLVYISILFAISDYTREKREEDYPLIFDAATSSLSESKERDFYDVIANIKKQCIIASKDFVKEDGKINEAAIEGLKCSIYRIKKAPNFDQSNVATIRTLIEKIR